MDAGATESELPQSAIGWLRAVVSGVVVLAVGLGLTVGGANWILTDLTGLSRDGRVWLATGLFLVVVGVVAWLLRRMQERGLI